MNWGNQKPFKRFIYSCKHEIRYLIIFVYIQVYWLPAPVFIMGVVATLAGVLAVFFPETLGEKLPETIDDALK